MSVLTKEELRREIRKLKNLYTKEQKDRFSEAICERLESHEKVIKAQVLIMYSPLPDEADILRLVNKLHDLGKTILLPKVVSATEMELRRYEGEASLAEGAFGIMEPTGEKVAYSDIPSGTVAIIPGMAFDAEGNRLGRGKGYYDRMIASIEYPITGNRPEKSNFINIKNNILYKVGVAFPFQKQEEIQHNDHDIKMNEVVIG